MEYGQPIEKIKWIGVQAMEINPSLTIYNTQRQIEQVKQDNEKSGELFEKIFTKEMFKGMYKTTQFRQEESAAEKDLYQEMTIDILSDTIVNSNILGIKEKYFTEE